MFFSKSFGYAVRGVLYIALMQDEKKFVQGEEISSRLGAPRHFMAKILKKLAKEKLLASAKGPFGGFTLAADTLKTPLKRIAYITEGGDLFETCVLSAKECNSANPCPMHFQAVGIKNELTKILSETTIDDLLNGDKTDFLKSLSAPPRSGTVEGKEKIY